MASLSGGDWLEKKDLYGAHPGDDTELDSGFHGHTVIMLEEFVAWVATTHDEREALAVGQMGVEGAGDKWLKRLITGLKGGVIHLETAGFTDEATREGPHQPHLDLSEWLFDRVASYAGEGAVALCRACMESRGAIDILIAILSK